MYGWIVLIAVVVIVLIWLAASYNSFIRARNNVEEAYATMDVYLKKRFDLIPNLVETVKGYAKHESETLLSVVAARNAVAAAATQSEKLAGEAQLTKSLKSLNVVAESYPEMKANSNFQELMRQLQSVENDITNARKYYNGCVKKYNIRLQSFPSSVIGGMFHFEKKNLFEISDVAERDNVKVEF